jgi:hypothetical protein
MEYPMLITVGTTWWMPAGVRVPEIVALHEVGHQYWYGLLASDEVEEAWLDEGINSYVEGLIMDETYGPGSYVDLLGLQIDAVPMARASYLAGGSWDPIATPSFRMLDREAYVAATYAKTALALRTLGGLLGGQDKVIAALGDYARRYRFAHPSERDFRTAFSATGEGRRAGGVAARHRHARPRRRARRRAPGAGAVPVATGMASAEARLSQRGRRRGAAARCVCRGHPVVYDDGGDTRETRDGQARWYRIDVTSTRQATHVVDRTTSSPSTRTASTTRSRAIRARAACGGSAAAGGCGCRARC